MAKWVLLLALPLGTLTAKDHSDVESMRAQPYMMHRVQVNCDSMDGNNAEHKVCLNLEFQEVDSLMNSRLMDYVAELADDSLRQAVLTYQQAWVENRRLESRLEAEGYRGHMLSIAYISNLVFITRRRLEELEHLIEYK